ncbi:reverse transcriptase [Trichonephila clavipes]|nr:reverse transcriptase [Trichonephila clavipes]GFV34932.1 reverse transcriptase [Trichonephila clavipes]
MTLCAPIQYYSTAVPSFPCKWLDLFNLTSNKPEVFPDVLKSSTLETIELRYPANEWLLVYIDGSFKPEVPVPLWFCRLFEDLLAVGKNAPSCDGEVSAVCEVTTQLLAPAKVVFLIDSHATISVLSSNISTDCLRTIK